jgi:hypothetical protein
MFAEESRETSDIVVEKSVAVEFCTMSVSQQRGYEVVVGRGRKY